MDIFNSYVKLPEGMTGETTSIFANFPPDFRNSNLVATICVNELTE